MFFSLIVCTYNRPDALANLLSSLRNQLSPPNEVIIVDSSDTGNTEEAIKNFILPAFKYYKVGDNNRGLTKQRNYGVKKANPETEVICFLDDDIVVEPDYFKNLIHTYTIYPNAIGVGGWIKDEIYWKIIDKNYQPAFNEFLIDGFVRRLGQRNVLRKRLGLLSNKPPGYMPEFAHGFSTGFLPPSGKTYQVEYFMGGVSSFRKELFEKIGFSNHFEGYGLYEDMDFCLRASRIGNLYVNTSACVWHFHEESGRPDYFKYGKMVIENGYYVWKLKYPESCFKSRIKYFSIDILLLLIRFYNGLAKDRISMDDAKGRAVGLIGLLFSWMKIIFWKRKDKNQAI